jgi:hypothetical protein
MSHSVGVRFETGLSVLDPHACLARLANAVDQLVMLTRLQLDTLLQ